MSGEPITFANEQTKSLEKRLSLLYLREKEVEVDAMVEDENGNLVKGKQTLYLRAPTKRQVLRNTFELRAKRPEDFELLEEGVPENFSVESASPEDQQAMLVVMEFGNGSTHQQC